MSRRRRIGLLGGSFNPAHEGHLHISREAIRRLRLDGVWWLVSPQNPLKPESGMAPFAERLASAEDKARADQRITATDIEERLGTRYTADTVETLTATMPEIRFVWLMGADNLAQIPKWERWSSIFHTVPVAVLTRPSYSLRALRGAAAARFAHYRVPMAKAAKLADMRPPAWTFLLVPGNSLSATKLRTHRDA